MEVEVAPHEGLLVASEGEGSQLPCTGEHLAAQVVSRVLGHDDFAVRVRSQIPLARGLGSSAALAVAAAAAAGAADPFTYGVAIDGHPENAAASALGGLVAASVIDGSAVARRLALDPRLRFVLLVPDRELATREARAVLPESVPFGDATFELGRLALLLAGLADHTLLVPAAGDDRLHQPRRSALFAEAPALLEGLRKVGALTSCWSGAGPSLLAVCAEGDAEAVAAEAAGLMGAQGVAGRVLLLDADLGGVQVQHEG